MRQTHKSVTSLSNKMRNKCIVDQITNTFIDILEKKLISDITVSEICQTAGVARASFYCNFKSKEDILHKYDESLIEE